MKFDKDLKYIELINFYGISIQKLIIFQQEKLNDKFYK